MNFDKILIVDDEPSVHQLLARHLCRKRYSVTAVGTLLEAQEQLRHERYDLALVDVVLPDGCGQQLIEPLLDGHNGGAPVVVMMSGHPDTEMACACIGEGAFDFMHKPFSFEEIDFLLHRARSFAHLLRQNTPSSAGRARERTSAKPPPVLLGHSAEVGQLKAVLRKVAPMKTTVLILGETGAGKGQVAEAIHSFSQRAHRRLQRVNCSAGNEEQVEVEIFGRTNRDGEWEPGRLEEAHQGTLLLEEVSELSLKLQHRLLRAMREHGFERDSAGRREFIPLDVRYLLTSCKELGEEVRCGRVRHDFFRKASVFPIEVFPLRARRGDLPLIAGEWLANFGERIGTQLKGITPEALEVLINYPWPGNLQEFEGALERALVLGGVECVIDAPAFDFLQAPPAPAPPDEAPSAPHESDATRLEPLLSLEEMEKRHVLRALEYTNQNRTRAAGLLKISVRTLRNKLHLYRLQADEAPPRLETGFFSTREPAGNLPNRKSLR